jgi:hypothetical protein
MKKYFLALTAALVGATLTGVNPVWANGYEFFTVDRARSVNLAYVGQIREKGSGRIVREPAYFMVTEKRSGMTFPFANDRPGHYRSPDIGESVEELAGTAVKPADLEFELLIEGYKKIKFTNAPRKDKGIVELNFAVERENGSGSGEPTQTASTPGQSANASSPSNAPGGAPAGGEGSRSLRLIFIAVAAVTIIAGGAARKLGDRQTSAS